MQIAFVHFMTRLIVCVHFMTRLSTTSAHFIPGRSRCTDAKKKRMYSSRRTEKVRRRKKEAEKEVRDWFRMLRLWAST